MSESVLKLQDLLNNGCKVERIYPSVLGSDTEVNIVTVEVKCPDGQIHKIRAYREEANELREFIRTKISDTK
ncbi:MAG TPA: hypothetical protein VD710_11575 [Nitrososphaeraceae archaeon]|nr:hypothetical protein [Nitrososphaeraceae archaeon]